MGCCGSTPVADEPIKHDSGPFHARDGRSGRTLAGKDSCLWLPPKLPSGPVPGISAPVPGIVMVHGNCMEGEVTGAIMGAVQGTGSFHWTHMNVLGEAVAKQAGVPVLVIALPDHDEDKYKVEGLIESLSNAWPMVDYANFLSTGIDHLIAAARKVGVQIDTAKIGLVGHSMGGAGVLRAAATTCKERIACVASLNPGHLALEKAWDLVEPCAKYATGAPHSGEHGEGVIAHLADLAAPVFIYGSQAEYNMELVPGTGLAGMWPCYPDVYAQLGSPTKELYVDNLIDKTCLEAHTWFTTKEDIGTYGDGLPLQALCSFVRRTLNGSTEALMPRPANAKEWKHQVGHRKEFTRHLPRGRTFIAPKHLSI